MQPATAIDGGRCGCGAIPAGIARFLLVGGILGAAGFWWAPIIVDALSGYDQVVFGATLFLFIGWTFINIHRNSCDPAALEPGGPLISVR